MKRFRQGKNKNRGFTLIEVIVSFALIGIFVSAVCVVVAAYAEISVKNTSISQSEILANNILETIASELSGAGAETTWYNQTEKGEDGISSSPVRAHLEELYNNRDECTMLLTEEKSVNGAYARLEDTDSEEANNSIYFENKISLLVRIQASTDGRLSILYGDQSGDTIPPTDWDFGEDVYMNNRIILLNFQSLEGEKQQNIIAVHLRLENTKTGYITDRTTYVECYNLSPDTVKTWNP